MVESIEKIDKMIAELDDTRLRKIGYNPKRNQELMSEIIELKKLKRKLLEDKQSGN